MINPTIGHYEILGKLGEGGMGIVHLARDSRLNRQVALKVLPPALAATPEARQRFTREAQSASALSSPNIVTIYEIGSDGDTDFIAMEYVRGETLAGILRRGPLTVETIVAHALQISAALSVAHAAGIVHRDLKPGNLMIGPDGILKVLDFGLAKPVAPTAGDPESGAHDTMTTPLTQLGLAIGTLAYMSPEQALGAPLDTRSDIFSFGAVLYEMASGQSPFAGPTPGDVFRRLHLSDPEPLTTARPDLPPALDALVRKALAKKPEDRYQSVTGLEEDLKRLCAQSGSASTTDWRSAPPNRTILPAWLNRFASKPALAGAAGILCLAALFAWHPWSGSPHTPPPSAQRWFDQGIAAIRDGTYHTASLALERAVAEDSAFPLAHIRLADAYFELDALDKAREELLLAVPKDSSSNLSPAEELYLQAVRLTLTADFEGAARKYASIRDSVSTQDRPSALVDYGRALEKAENIKGATAAYEEAARLQAQYPSAFLRLGILHRRRLDQAQAGVAFRQAESLYRSLGNVEGLTEVNYQRGVLLNNLGNYREAKTILDQALGMARTAQNHQQQITILLQLSSVMQRLDDSNQARESASAAIHLAQGKGLEPLAARGLIDLGNSYFVAGGTAEARNYFQQALETARRNKSRRTEARALLSLGSLDIQSGDLSAGLKNVELALSFYRQGGYRKETSQGLLLAGRAHRSLGDYEGAHKAFEEQHHRALEVGDLEQVRLSLEAMGSVRLLQGRLPEALSSFQDALATSATTSDSLALAYIRMNCATALWRLGRYAEAEQIIATLESSESKADSNRVIAAMLAQLRAAIALSRRQYAASAAIAKRLLAKPGLNSAVLAETSTLLANSHAFSGDVPLALKTARDALAQASAAGRPDLAVAALTAQASAQLEAGRFSDAVDSAVAAHRDAGSSTDRESAWRILLLVARASAATGQMDRARQFASQASGGLDEVERLFGPTNFDSYSRRPDVQFERGVLNSLLNPAKTLVRVKGPSR